MNFSVNRIGKHLSPVVKQPLINTTLGTRTWKITPPYMILGFTVDKVPSYSSLYVVLPSALAGKQTGDTLSNLQREKMVCSTAIATVNFNSALAKDELLT